jgi:hypothetical protein
MVEYLGTQTKVTPYKIVCLKFHETLLYLPEDKELLEFTEQKCPLCGSSMHYYILKKGDGLFLRLLNDEKLRKAEEMAKEMEEKQRADTLRMQELERKHHEEGIKKAEELKRKAQVVQDKTAKEKEAERLDAERKEANRKSNTLKKKITQLKAEVEGDANLLAQLEALELQADEDTGAEE